MEKFPMDQAQWQTGLPLDEFVSGMQTHQADMRRRLREVRLAESDCADFVRVLSPLHALVMTEDWCGDSLMNLPILARIVEAAPGMELRIFGRAGSPDLNDYYTARNIKAIPVFTFLNADFNEIGTWVERPQSAHARVQEWLAARPEVEAIRNDPAFTDEARRARLRPLFDGMLAEMEGWYADGLQAATVSELKTILFDRLTECRCYCSPPPDARPANGAPSQ